MILLAVGGLRAAPIPGPKQAACKTDSPEKDTHLVSLNLGVPRPMPAPANDACDGRRTLGGRRARAAPPGHTGAGGDGYAARVVGAA